MYSIGEMSIEAFTCLLVFKNIFSFALTFKGFDWIVAGHIRPVFMAIASVQVGICALTIPMYVLGKWNRSFFHRYVWSQCLIVVFRNADLVLYRHKVFFKLTDWIADRLTFW
jgi:hypothetical protein